jgi:hypothetical protein
MSIAARPEVIPMELNRDYVLRTTRGHAIEFKKNQPTNVPMSCYADAVAIGAVRSDGKPADVIADEVDTTLTGEAREARLREVLETLEERAGRDDFTATGVPTVSAVNREAGDIGEKFDSRSIADAWKEMHAPAE